MITPVLRVAIREQMTGEPEVEVSKRIETLSDVIYRTTVIAITVVGVVTILPNFGINAGPLIAGLGLVGLAVGFGAQSLVKDVINGLEVLIENHYGRGDFIKVRTTSGGNVGGVVEDMNLRRTVLRDFDGAVHFISHGTIEVVSNETKGYSGIGFNVSLPAGADLDRVYELIDRVGLELAHDPQFAASVREAPKAAGVEGFGGAQLLVRIQGVTEPGDHWAVTRELRARLKKAFEAEGISDALFATAGSAAAATPPPSGAPPDSSSPPRT